MDILIRNIDEKYIDRIDELSKENKKSRNEYLVNVIESHATKEKEIYKSILNKSIKNELEILLKEDHEEIKSFIQIFTDITKNMVKENKASIEKLKEIIDILSE